MIERGAILSSFGGAGRQNPGADRAEGPRWECRGVWPVPAHRYNTPRDPEMDLTKTLSTASIMTIRENLRRGSDLPPGAARDVNSLIRAIAAALAPGADLREADLGGAVEVLDMLRQGALERLPAAEIDLDALAALAKGLVSHLDSLDKPQDEKAQSKGIRRGSSPLATVSAPVGGRSKGGTRESAAEDAGTFSEPDRTRRKLRQAAWFFLDLARRRPVPALVQRAGILDRWWPLILGLIDASQFTFAPLFAQRVESGGTRTLFRVPSKGEAGRHSWLEVSASVDRIARGLLALAAETGPGPVAILSENRYEMALIDLACLTTGILNVMIPAPSTADDVEFVLKESEAVILVLSGERQLRKVPQGGSAAPKLKAIVSLDEPARGAAGILSLGELIARGRVISPGQLARVRDGVKLADTASVMYTSGTTGKPKGIRFNVRCIVTKRFARGLAIPEIGDQDVFLCYLPLFHTFGRYFEMTGAIFWGATYVFQETPALDALVEGCRRFRPTVLISIPKKWIELYEEIGRLVDVVEASPEAVQAATRRVVGDRLRWGLSAAGYLPPAVFRFFQSQGVELMSGFGMTEATGGITMTPPGQYRDDSLGLPLPGLDAALSPEGELMIRGPYVMIGYQGAAAGEGPDADGWLRTGDLLSKDADGHFYFVDRKKDIYKNLRGETITPQRIENQFRGFEAVERVFVVGEHREYNTALVVPKLECPEPPVGAMTPEERRTYYRSLISMVNRFLAPFERILDFALLDRDFSAEKGEVTPKSTFKRRVIEENFAETIDALYQRARLHLWGISAAVRLPNWLLQASGLTAEDVYVEGTELVAEPTGAHLRFEHLGQEGAAELVRIGSCRYRVAGHTIDLGVLLSSPSLWLGNTELLRFLPLDSESRVRRRRPSSDLRRYECDEPFETTSEALETLRAAAAGETAPTLELTDLAARAAASADETAGALAIEYLAGPLASAERTLVEAALQALRQAAGSPSRDLRVKAFLRLYPAEHEGEARASFLRFAAAAEPLLDPDLRARLARETLTDDKLQVIIGWLHAPLRSKGTVSLDAGRMAPWLELLADYGATHPSKFRRLRWALAFVEAFAPVDDLAAAARTARERLASGFRDWLGVPMVVAVDPDTGQEYRREDILAFAGDVTAEERGRFVAAVRDASLLREAVFVVGGSALVRLSDVPPGGATISVLTRRADRTVLRASLATRYQGTFDLAITMMKTLTREAAEAETLWSIVAGGERDEDRLLPDFGGWWPGQGIWTEEFVAGETMDRVIVRLASDKEEGARERLSSLVPFLVWSAASAYLGFWAATSRRFEAADPSPGSVIAPTHDYQVGPRLLEVADRRRFEGMAPMLLALRSGLADRIEREHPSLAGLAPVQIVFAALLETVGTTEGIELLRRAAQEDDRLSAAVSAFAEDVERRGFMPMKLRLAIERYRRWETLAPSATREAKAASVQELYETYRLEALAPRCPEVRLRFFRETVFVRSAEGLGRALDDLIAASHGLDSEDLAERIRGLRSSIAPGSDEEYFLVRLSYPHLDPGTSAVFFSTSFGGARHADVLVTLKDTQGRRYHVRPPISPQEVARLHRLFVSARLPVTFGPDHQFLLAVTERGDLQGGLFYEADIETKESHLSKIVVAERSLRQGVGEGLVREFIERMRDLGVTHVTTGFFRPSFLRRLGFTLDPSRGGMVLSLAAKDEKSGRAPRRRKS